MPQRRAMLPNIRAVFATIAVTVALLIIASGVVATFRIAQESRAGSLHADLAQRGHAVAPQPKPIVVIETPGLTLLTKAPEPEPAPLRAPQEQAPRPAEPPLPESAQAAQPPAVAPEPSAGAARVAPGGVAVRGGASAHLPLIYVRYVARSIVPAAEPARLCKRTATGST